LNNLEEKINGELETVEKLKGHGKQFFNQHNLTLLSITFTLPAKCHGRAQGLE